MDKVDFKKTLSHLYRPSSKAFSVVEVPAMNFIMIDGKGDPGTSEDYASAIQWLYATSYPIKFVSKNDHDRDYVAPPLEGLWWAEDMSAFTRGDRESWSWTSMMMLPDWITIDMYQEGLAAAQAKLGEPHESMRLEQFNEGKAVQIMHFGPFTDEAPTIARLHGEFLPENDFVENGHHHEIYLSDPRRTAPEKLKTVIRQPVAIRR